MPPLFSQLVRAPSRRALGEGSLGGRVVDASQQEREGVVLDAVRAELAVVLGHGSAAAIDVQRTFKDLGLRLADGGRVAQPAGCRHRAAACRPR